MCVGDVKHVPGIERGKKNHFLKKLKPQIENPIYFTFTTLWRRRPEKQQQVEAPIAEGEVRTLQLFTSTRREKEEMQRPHILCVESGSGSLSWRPFGWQGQR